MTPVSLAPPGATVPRGAAQALNTPQADRLEGAFLEQMLTYMGPKAREGAGSGGQAEGQFQSFLNQEYARILAGRIDLRLDRGGAR